MQIKVIFFDLDDRLIHEEQIAAVADRYVTRRYSRCHPIVGRAPNANRDGG
jgi:hypothetical protein